MEYGIGAMKTSYTEYRATDRGMSRESMYRL